MKKILIISKKLIHIEKSKKEVLDIATFGELESSRKPNGNEDQGRKDEP